MDDQAGVADAITTILGVLARVLPPGTPVAADTPLVTLGLGSLAAARVLLEVGSALGAELPMDATRTCRDARELAALAVGSRNHGGLRPQVRATPSARHEPFPLTPLQEAYLLGKSLGADGIGCHVYREFAVPDLDLDRLRAAWGRLVEHHDALRLVTTADGRQRIVPDAPPWTMPVHDDVLAVRNRLSHRAYRADESPLWSVEATRNPDGSGVLHLSVDALVTDGAGLELLVDQLRACYDDPACVLPGGGFGVRDLVVALGEHQSGDTCRASLGYWMDRLRDLPPGPALPAGDTPPDNRRTPHTAELTPREWAAVRDWAAEAGVSATSLVLTVFTEALQRVCDEPKFSLVLTTSSRLVLPAAADTVVGPFTSTAIFVAEPSAGLPLTEAAKRVHGRLRRDLDHAAVPGVAVLRAMRAQRLPVPDALPVVFTSLIGVGGGKAEGSYALSQTTGVTLDAQVAERDGGLVVRWDVVDSAFRPGVVEGAFGWFVNALRWLWPGTATAPRPLNDLQQAYFVARSTDGVGPWSGCQVCHGFRVEHLDLPRLEAAWLGLLADHEVLRTVVTHDGTLAVHDTAPDRWHIPVSTGDVQQDMVSRAYPLGRLPQGELRVTRDDDGLTVHIALDLLVADGRSIHLLMRELMRRYCDPTAPALQAAPYAEFVATRKELRAGPEHAPARQHWRDRFAALPSGPPLGPLTGPRTRLTATVTGWSRCRERAQARGLSLDAVVITALTEALGTHFADDFAVPLVRWARAVERFRPAEVTALSWVPRAEPGLPFAEAARRTDAVIAADTAADAASGLAELRTVVLRRRRTGEFGYPVVCTGLLELADAPLPPGIEPGPWLTCTPDVGLDCIAVDEGGDELRLFWDAVRGAVPDDVLTGIFAAYQEILRRLGADEDAWTADRGREAERELVLRTWNDTARDFPHDGPVHLLFEEQARIRPDAVTVRGRGRGGTTTYRELNATANRIAARLKQAGVGPESVVGLSIARGPLMVAAVFGVLKAGGAYLPVEPSMPAARAATMLADAGAVALVTTSDLDPPADGRPVVHADRLGDAVEPDPAPAVDENATAYVIFTSGSTGRPKGVAVNHRAVHNLLHWTRRTFGFGPADLGLCVTSLGFDLSVFDLLGLLGFGASVYVADAEQQRDPALLLDVLLDEPITFWNSAPTTLAHVAPLMAAHRGGPRTRDLRLVFLSGDYTPLGLPGELRACFTGADVISLGGATEATVWSNWFRVGEIDPEWHSIPYGRPIDNARYYVLDADREPCRIGQEGDLYIAGEVLSLGYRNRPELTRERFVPCPFEPGALMYRTGDRASFFPDGNIRFLGRADHQVKIRGFRVEPGEIEHRLRTHPAVKDAVVVPRDENGERKLVAYVVPMPGAAPAAKELRTHTAETLPDYMVPNHIAVLDRLPATANGKLDRDALPWPLPPAPSTAPEPTAVVPEPALPEPAVPEPVPVPATPVVAEPGPAAEDLRGMLTALLGELVGEAVDPAADLWDQGATSFTMVQVSTRLQERFGTRVPVAVLLDNPTIDGIAAHVASVVGLPTTATDPTTAPPTAPPTAEPTPEPTATPVPDVATEPVVDVLSPTDRAAFATARWDLRDDGTSLPLPDTRPDEHLYRWRGTRRDFRPDPVPFTALTSLLALLRPLPDGDRRRRLYPSAGDTYGVQVYVHVADDRVSGVDSGVYYYHPDEHALRRISDGSDLGRSAHFVYNRPVYDRAAFEIFLVGQAKAVRPLYGEESERFLALEAGYLGQLLMSGQAAHGLGLCPVGAVAVDPVRRALRLDQDHVFLQSFLGGAVDHVTGPAETGPAGTGKAGTGSAEVAVVGMAGRYPEADDLDALWRNLLDGRCSVAAPPAARGDGPAGGYLRDVESFDSAVFGIAPAEAATLDPQLRLLLEVVWVCLEDAGHTSASLGRVGVFVGLMWHDHRLVGNDRWRAEGSARISGTGSEVANRVSHVFDFRGPSLAVDTSCSSSLTALQLAVESLRRGDCDAAVVGAANLLLHPYHASVLRGLDLVAETPGRALDAEAAGWSPGEAVGAVLLRRLADARADGDTVHGVVESAWVGHTGGTGRFGTPDVATLTASLSRALDQAGLTPDDIGYVECAASGAALSDAAEVEAVGRLFGDRAPVPAGTLKPNLGHAEAASGLAQLTKVLLQLRHGALAPTLLSDRPTALVDLDGLPITFVTEPAPWTGTPLRALVNAVGATGSVGHVVLRSPEPEEDR
ncbi:non-ribosomal peptide synthetase [Saccharothrix espanaensis]|uniref:Hybrid nonribosomal peptide synthetase / polyketide synthase n=1 Tax=Saccharothrix espanaensis (strain ATCC 51144 / DSM 44229 / JCM 9112 / NBRC 15066 / NRRL 15764) TaxID=1179773 RepID=K0JVJ6_SACES|nr:non-ribosomal peptide synthetase [Saccharothrix espanaensis]CCH31885.1 Hybrid nonribosomal peptide synthetase / polyketide synthase [Saccharothrix espanaensis DSM 44229]